MATIVDPFRKFYWNFNPNNSICTLQLLGKGGKTTIFTATAQQKCLPQLNRVELTHIDFTPFICSIRRLIVDLLFDRPWATLVIFNPINVPPADVVPLTPSGITIHTHDETMQWVGGDDHY